MPAMLPNRGKAAMLRSAVLALGVGAVTLPASVQACAVMSKEGEARRAREQAQWLVKETDLKVRGTFVEEPLSAEEQENEDFFRKGIVIAADGRRFSVTSSMEINCGFPNLWISDGDKGLFYFKRYDDPVDSDEEDLADGVIDNFDFIHFRSGRGK